MDHAFGFPAVDVRSNPTRLLSSLFICFMLLLLFLFTYILAFFLGYFLIRHENLFPNVARAEFECIFSFVSLLFISYFDVSVELEKYMQGVYKPSENNDSNKQ